MEITSIIIRRISLESKMKAIVSITFDNAFVVHDVKVIEGANGLFIAMPSRRTQEGDFKDIVHPINSEFREDLSRAVLEKYQAALADYLADETHHEVIKSMPVQSVEIDTP
jgi:stage V sporulation protein G